MITFESECMCIEFAKGTISTQKTAAQTLAHVCDTDERKIPMRWVCKSDTVHLFALYFAIVDSIPIGSPLLFVSASIFREKIEPLTMGVIMNPAIYVTLSTKDPHNARIWYLLHSSFMNLKDDFLCLAPCACVRYVFQPKWSVWRKRLFQFSHPT